MKRILVVDDEVAITRLIKLNLEAAGGYLVSTENKASRAVEAVRNFKPDLVLLDIMMPDALGTDIAAQLQDDPGLRHVKIIFLTAIARKGETEAGHPVGGQIIIAKPATVEELLTAIESALACV
jgi:CheY-like chemotaxis protein